MLIPVLGLAVASLVAPQPNAADGAIAALNNAIALVTEGEYERGIPALNDAVQQVQKASKGVQDKLVADALLTGIRRSFLYRGYALVGLGREEEARQNFANAFALTKFENKEADTSGDRSVLQSPLFGPKIKALYQSGIELARSGKPIPTLCIDDSPAIMFWSEKGGKACANYDRSATSPTISLVTAHMHKASFCLGQLSISPTRVAFRPLSPKDAKDSFDIPLSELKKGAGTRRIGLGLGRVLSVDTAERSYNFAVSLTPAFNDFVDLAFTDFAAAEKIVVDTLKPNS